MQTEIFYRNIGKTENLESYLLEKTEAIVEPYLKYDSNAKLTVRVETIRSRNQNNRKPHYTCEVILKPSFKKGTFKVQKSGTNFYEAVVKTTSALKHIIKKMSGIKSDHGRRHAA